MIKNIKLKNWKSFKNMDFKTQSINILIGGNASGKTNFLEALELLQKMGRNASEDEIREIRGGQRFFKNKKSEDEILLECEIEIEGKDYKYEIYEKEKRIGDKVINDKEETKITINPSIIKAGSIASLSLEKQFPLKELVKEKELSKITVLDPIPREIRKNIGDMYSSYISKDCGNIISYITNLPIEKKSMIEKELLKYLPSLLDMDIESISFKKIGEMEEGSQLYLEERINGKVEKVHTDIISDGTLRFIAIIGAMLCQAEGSLLAIEEVDNGIAPAKTKLLLNILNEISYERNIDIIMTTHNTALMNYLTTELFEFIFFTYRDKKGYSQIKRIAEIKRVPKLISFGKIGELMEDNRILKFIEEDE